MLLFQPCHPNLNPNIQKVGRSLSPDLPTMTYSLSAKFTANIFLQRGQVRSQMTRRWLRCWCRVRAPASWCFQGPVVPIFPLRCQFLALSCIREHYTGLFRRRYFHFAGAYISERPVSIVDCSQFLCLMWNE